MDDAALPITSVALHLVEAAEQGLVDSVLAAALIRTAASRIRARIREIDAILRRACLCGAASRFASGSDVKRRGRRRIRRHSARISQ